MKSFSRAEDARALFTHQAHKISVPIRRTIICNLLDLKKFVFGY